MLMVQKFSRPPTFPLPHLPLSRLHVTQELKLIYKFEFNPIKLLFFLEHTFHHSFDPSNTPPHKTKSKFYSIFCRTTAEKWPNRLFKS